MNPGAPLVRFVPELLGRSVDLLHLGLVEANQSLVERLVVGGGLGVTFQLRIRYGKVETQGSAKHL